MRMVVVLPAPLSPSRAKIDPPGTWRPSAATAVFLPKCLHSPRISIAGSMRAFLRSCEIGGSAPLFGARQFAIGPGELLVHQFADLFGRQGTGRRLPQRLADAAAHDLPPLG